MESKEYLDKVIDYIVRDTKIDYDYKKIFSTPFNHNVYPTIYFSPLRKYCMNIFGLTEEETIYVWKEYKKIIDNKLLI